MSDQHGKPRSMTKADRTLDGLGAPPPMTAREELRAGVDPQDARHPVTIIAYFLLAIAGIGAAVGLGIVIVGLLVQLAHLVWHVPC